MKTITYNPETHVLVPREPSEEMLQAALRANMQHVIDCINDPAKSKDIGSEETCKQTYRSSYASMIAAAPQPEPNHNWCAGCSPDNCSGCGGEPVDSEPAMWVMKHIRSGDLAQAKPNQKALHPYMWSDAFPRYTTPQPVRVAELEAETTKLKLDLLTSYGEAEELSGKVAELEKVLKVAREGIDKFLVAKNSTEFDCACDLSVGYLCGPCHADKQQQQLLESVLAKINEVLHD